MVWATTEGRTARVPRGSRCFDIMGNPVNGPSVRLSGAPIYIIGTPGKARRLVRL